MKIVEKIQVTFSNNETSAMWKCSDTVDGSILGYVDCETKKFIPSLGVFYTADMLDDIKNFMKHSAYFKR
jgi:hypothetical protein